MGQCFGGGLTTMNPMNALSQGAAETKIPKPQSLNFLMA